MTGALPRPGEGTPLVAVTDHAAERFRQRVGSRTGAVDVKPEIVQRVARAWSAGRVLDVAPAGAKGTAGSLYVRDATDRGVLYVCRDTGGEVLVITLWEDPAAVGGPRVPRRFTDVLKDTDQAVDDRRPEDRERSRDR